jgi:hypothetical protein
MFETVFIYSDGLEHKHYIKIILVCIGTIGFILLPVISKKKNGRKLDEIDRTIIYFSLIPLFLMLSYFIIYISQINKFAFYKSCYLTGRYEITEGVVEVLIEQPSEGHSRGDLVEINGVRFTIDYYSMELLYRNTISHGGYLQKGVYAKIYYSGKQILRIDIKKI